MNGTEKKKLEGEPLPDELLDGNGRVVARRIKSGELGDLWLVPNRATAEALGLVGTRKNTMAPVYFLDGTEAEFVKGLTPEARRLYHAFKKEFDSPGPAPEENASARETAGSAAKITHEVKDKP